MPATIPNANDESSLRGESRRCKNCPKWDFFARSGYIFWLHARIDKGWQAKSRQVDFRENQLPDPFK